MSSSYDFATLAPDDFERLVADLVGAMLGERLQEFKEGRDAGVDLRYATPEHPQSLVVQCKLFATNAYRRLVKVLERDELPKIRRLKPERYLFATSVPLSPPQKDGLAGLLSPWCQSSNDVLGREDLNGLLRAFPAIEKQHFKLWLTSTEMLQSIVSAGVWSLTASTVEEVRREICRFYEHPGVGAAKQLLEDYHHCLIVGVPGIGKTTLAQILMYQYIGDGYMPVIVSADIEEAWSVVRANEQRSDKIIILYDDFLGQVDFQTQKLEKNEDRRLISLIDYVERTASVRLLLTTREYILADAMKHYAALARDSGKIQRFVLQLGHYDEASRAKILFNHLYFSDLPSSRLNAFVTHSMYWRIIRHQNYNPRIIRSIAEHRKFSSLSDREYEQAIVNLLDDPTDVWGHAFDNQITPDSRRFMLALWALGPRVPLSLLREQLVQAFKPIDNLDFDSRMLHCLRELDGNFIHTLRCQVGLRPVTGSDTLVSFHNPSVRDFLEKRVKAQSSLLDDSARAITTFDQALTILKAFSSLPVDEGKRLMRREVFRAAVGLLGAPSPEPATFRGLQYIRTPPPDVFSRSAALIGLCGDQYDVDQLRSAIAPWFATSEAIEEAVSRSSLTSVTALLWRCAQCEPWESDRPVLLSTEVAHAREVLSAIAADEASSASSFAELLDIFDAFDKPELHSVIPALVTRWNIGQIAERLLAEADAGEVSTDRLRDEVENLGLCAAHLDMDVDDWLADLSRLLPKSEPKVEPTDSSLGRNYARELDIESLFMSLHNIRDSE